MKRTTGSNDDSDQTGGMCPRQACPPARLHCLDELDGLEGFVHIADGQVKAEVEHGVAGGLLAVLQAHKVSESSPGHHVGELGNRPPRRLGRHR